MNAVLEASGQPATADSSHPWDARACLDRVRSGQTDAAEELVQNLLPLVRKIASTHLNRRSSPDDLCQEIFVKIFSKLDQYTPIMPLEHWVARVAINTCRDHFRSSQRNPEIRWSDLSDGEIAWIDSRTSSHPSPSSAHTHAADLAARDLATRLLDTLSPDDRLVITLLDLENQTAPEVARLTGWSQTGIRVRAFRARRKLRKALHRLEQERAPE